VQLHSFLRGFGFPLQSTRDLHSSGMQRRVVIPYRRFGTSYRSHFFILEDGTGRLSRNVGRKLLL
jgi:hypothetical protein